MGRFEALNHSVFIIWTTRPAWNSDLIYPPPQSRHSYSMQGMGLEDFKVYQQQQCLLSRGLHSRKENNHKNYSKHHKSQATTTTTTGYRTECLPHAKLTSKLFQSLITGINEVHWNKSKPFPQSAVAGVSHHPLCGTDNQLWIQKWESLTYEMQEGSGVLQLDVVAMGN